MEKAKFWKKMAWVFMGLFLLFAILMVVTYKLDTNLNEASRQQKLQNDAWLILEESSNETVKALRNLSQTGDTFTFIQKWQDINQIITVTNDDLSQWKEFTMVYNSYPEQFELVLKGQLDPQEMLVEVDSSYQWITPLVDIFMILFIVCIFLGLTSAMISEFNEPKKYETPEVK